MLTTTAVVATQAPARYAKQLLSHLGRKATVEPVSEPEPAGRLVFGYGTGQVLPGTDALVLIASADDQEALDRLQDVLGRHLERFGARNELKVAWGPVTTE